MPDDPVRPVTALMTMIIEPIMFNLMRVVHVKAVAIVHLIESLSEKCFISPSIDVVQLSKCVLILSH